MSTGDMRNVSIGMGESVEAIFPSASVPGGRNVAGGVDAEDPRAVAGRIISGALRNLSFPQ